MTRLLLAKVATAVMWFGWPSEASYSFITLGDWGGAALGGYHGQDARDVASQMGKTADANKIKFIVNTGDNFYYCGIQNTSDFQIKSDYLSIYTAASLQVPWYSTLGNHEYGYNVQAQVDFTKVDPSKRWYMPARYYTKRIELTAGQHLTLIVTDTNPCISAYQSSDSSNWDPCGSDFPSCAPIDEGPCKFHENIASQDCSAQLTWFKAQLAAVPKDDWLIIVGHHPADELNVEDFTSAFQSHGFDLYLNGHVHLLQQYTIDGKGAYVTSGAGAMVDTQDQHNDLRCADPSSSNLTSSGHSMQSLWKQKKAGFTLHTFSDDFKTLKTDFVSFTGETLQSFTVSKGVSPAPTPSPSPGPPSPTPSPGPPGVCGQKRHWPCSQGCTYIHKLHEHVCQVSEYGCYDCAKLPASCPECRKDQEVFAV